MQPWGHTLRIAMPLYKGAPLIEDKFLVLAGVCVYIERTHGSLVSGMKRSLTGICIDFRTLLIYTRRWLRLVGERMH